MTRPALEALLRDASRLGLSIPNDGVVSAEQMAMIDALAGKHCRNYVPPLRWDEEGKPMPLYEATLEAAQATIGGTS
jgi:hypothetical protein